MNQLIGKVVDWTISHIPEKAQGLVTRYGLFGLTWLGLRRIPVALLRGPTNPSGQTGTLLVAGDDPWVGYLPSRFFVGNPQRERIGNVLAWELPALLNRLRPSADLTILRADRLSAQKFLGNDYLSVPEWIGMRLVVPKDLDALVHGNRSIREDMRLVRRHKLQPLVTEGEERFHEFYDSMYLPFSQARHGEMTYVKSQPDLRHRLRTGGILWVTRDNRPLAGMLFERIRNTLVLEALGMVTGELPLNKRGIMAALYYYSIAHATRLGCVEVDFRGTRPSLHDGLLRYKRKWGNVLYDRADTYYDLLVHWNRVNRVVKDFLSHTGLIFREKGGLSAIHADESQTYRSLWIGGLHQLYLLTEWGRQPMRNEETTLSIGGAGPDSPHTYQCVR